MCIYIYIYTHDYIWLLEVIAIGRLGEHAARATPLLTRCLQDIKHVCVYIYIYIYRYIYN